MVNMTSYQSFNIKSIQSALREVGLYQGSIDGLFGNGCYIGLQKLFGDNVTVKRSASLDPSPVFKSIQQALIDDGYDLHGGADGIYGKTSIKSFNDKIEQYRVANGLNVYGYAWSNHGNIPQEGIDKIEKWLVSHGKPKEHVSYLLSCMSFESAGTFKPSIQNSSTKATGLIQIMPANARELGTTVEHLKTLSFVEYLDWAFKYFEIYHYIDKCNDIADYYLSIFRPASVGKSLNNVIAKAGTTLYAQNKVFDSTGKGFFTNGDISKPVIDRYFDGMSPSKRKVL